MRKVLPWLAAERPEVFNAYQQTQGARLERVMERMVGPGHVASFIGHEPGKALFAGIYRIVSARTLSYRDYWRIPAYVEMKQAFGMKGWTPEDDRRSAQWFDLELLAHYASWQGKLVVGWPPPERSWWRRADRNELPVLAVLEESPLATVMPDWTELQLTWAELRVMPAAWKATLSHWRGIYFIHDSSDGKGYVGAAYGKDNLLGRWLDYAARGHGGNVLLRSRDPRHFTFSLLQRVSPDIDSSEVIRLEASWKARLHTRAPRGLNEN